MKNIILFFLLLFSVSLSAQLDQFRMIGTASWTVDSPTNYSATVTFQSDLTGNGFFPTGITDSMYVFSQTGQVYTIFSIANATFSTADLVIVESGGDWGSPIGQLMFYEDEARATVPAIPFGSTGAVAKMKESVDTYNSRAQDFNAKKTETVKSINEADLTNESVNLYDRVIIKETGDIFDILGDSVEFYETDGINVIDKGSGLFAVKDISSKRFFINKQELKNEFPLLGLKGGEYITVSGLKYKVSYSPPDNSTSAEDTPVIDGFFLDTLNINYQGRNLAPFSNRVEEFGTPTNYNISNGVLLQNYGIGPSGKKTAEGIYFTGTTQDLKIRVPNQLANTQYTLNFKAKAVNQITTGVVQARLSGGTYVTQAFTPSQSEWTDYQLILNPSVSPGTEIQMIWFANVPLDSIFLITDIDVQEGVINDTYEETGNDVGALGDKLYLTLDIVENGVLELDKLYNENKSVASNDAILIQQAIDFCAEGNKCQFVQFGNRKYSIDNTIFGKDNVQLLGVKGASRRTYLVTDTKQGTLIEVTIQDSTINAFEFDSGGATMFSTGMSNMNIELATGSRVNSMIYSNEVHGSIFENLSVYSSNQRDSITYAYNFNADISGSDNYHNDANNISAYNVKTGVKYSGSTINNINKVNILDADVGVLITKGTLQGNRWTLQNCTTAIHQEALSGNETFVKQLYTEGSGSGSACIIVEGGSMRIYNSTLLVDTSPDTLIRVTNSDYISIESSRINSSYPMYFDNTQSVVFDNVESFNDLKTHTFLGSNMNVGNIEYRDQSILSSRTDLRKFRLDNLVTNESIIDKSVISNAIITDTSFISAHTLIGKKENLIIDSSPWIDAAIGSLSDITIRANQSDPFGGTTGCTMIYGSTGAGASTAWISSTNIDTIQVGEHFTFSFWLKRHVNKPFSIIISPSGGDSYLVTTSYSPVNEWERIQYTDVLSTRVSGALTIRALESAAMVALDSFSIAGFSIERGKNATTYVETTVGGVISTDIETTIIDADNNWDITGGLIISGDVNVQGSLDATTWNIDINDVSNIDITTPADGQILQYQSISSTWDNVEQPNPVYSGAFMEVTGGGTVTAAGVQERIDNDTPGTTVDFLSDDFTVASSQVTYTGLTTKTFICDVHISTAFSSAADVDYDLAINGTAIGTGFQRINNSNDVGAIGFKKYVTLNTNDILTVEITSVAAETSQPVVYNLSVVEF